jgi:hypothetical protein
MKKALTALLFFVFFAVPASAQWKDAIKSFLPQISSPAGEQAGVAFYGTPLQILNGTPFFCRLVAGGKDLGILGPGEIAFDLRHWHNLYVQYVPVAVVCYRDVAAIDYVGAAGRVLTLGDNTPAEWTIRLSDIRTPDGRIPVSAPTTAATPTSRRIKLPREWWASSVGVQVVNNTTSDAKIFINGRLLGTLPPAGVSHIRAELVGGYTRPIIITITNGRDCTYTEQVWVQRNYPWARQIIFGPEYCGWSRWR